MAITKDHLSKYLTQTTRFKGAWQTVRDVSTNDLW